MTNQEINIRLALAIGWQVFDHTDWAVMGPIAEKFNAFPIGCCMGQWLAHGEVHSTPATASALAVIKYIESQE